MTEPSPASGRELTPSLRMLAAIRDRTPARVFAGRSGLGYRTATQLELRADHAAARDAVQAEIDLDRDFPKPFIAERGLFAVSTMAASKQEFLRRPDLGRRLSDEASAEIIRRCPGGVDVQLLIGDGLSAAAVIRQTPELLPALESQFVAQGWMIGHTFLIHHCRVGVLNEVGRLVSPRVAVLLIGERPGLATAESLSVYLAWRPKPGDTDARRNLISNIHARGVSIEAAACRITALALQMMHRGLSGSELKETLPDGTPTQLLGGPTPNRLTH